MLFPQVMVSSSLLLIHLFLFLTHHLFLLHFLPPVLRHVILLPSLSSRGFSLLWVCRGDPFYAERSHDTVVKNVVNCAACVLALTLAGVNTFERVNLA